MICPKVKSHDRCRPFGHIKYGSCLEQPGYGVAAPVHDLEPQRRVRLLWIECTRAIKVCRRFGNCAEIEVRDAAFQIDARVVGIELDDAIVIGNRMFVVALRQIGVAPAVVGMSGTIELDRLGVIGDGAFVLAFCAECFAPIAVGGRVFGIEADSAVVICDCLIAVALRRESIPTISIGADGGVELDRAVAVSYGKIELLIIDVRGARFSKAHDRPWPNTPPDCINAGQASIRWIAQSV